MPPDPDNVERRVELSGDYQEEKAYIEFYTNSSVAIARGESEVKNLNRVWLDGLEKQALHEALADHLGEVEEVSVELTR